MQITCPRKDLLEAAQFVGQGVSARSTLPILSNVWLAAEDDGIALMSSDLEMWVRRSLPSVPGEVGATTVPARMFAEILSALPEGDAQITIGERNEIEVRSGTARYTLMGLSAEEFPPMPDFAPETSPSAMTRGRPSRWCARYARGSTTPPTLPTTTSRTSPKTTGSRPTRKVGSVEFHTQRRSWSDETVVDQA